jgi:predicted nucleic-acid-binding Zn-ribbon protein
LVIEHFFINALSLLKARCYWGKERPQLQIINVFTVDLAKIGGKGDFKCPRCGVRISPDDQTEDTYMILETIMKGESLEQIALQCNKCKSLIQLTGFQVLDRIR